MFAYPSGHAHVGHVRNYMIGDIVARMKRMRGFNVLHPFGWDAFGLPAENAAIKNDIHPETWTLENIAHMKGQLQRIGISYAWERELATCLPDYYRWNQWLFTADARARSGLPQAVERQLVPELQDRARQRAGRRRRLLALRHAGDERDLEQWFFRITAYADELLEAAESLDGWPEKVLTMQRNWIGRSEGARVQFPLAPRADARADGIEVFTTRIDTIYGATFRPARAGASARRSSCARESGDPSGFARRRCGASRRRIARRGMTGEVEKEGFDTGRRAINPFTGTTSARLGRELRAGRIRHGRGHGRAGARPARLRVCPQVRPADHGRRPSAGRTRPRSPSRR